MKQFIVITHTGTKSVVSGPHSDYERGRKEFLSIVEKNNALNASGKPGDVDRVELWDSATGVRKRAKFLNSSQVTAIKKAKELEAKIAEQQQTEKESKGKK
jgi:hypothetical protein